MSSLSLSFSSLSALNIKEKEQEEQEAFAISKQIISQKVSKTQIFEANNHFLLQTGVSTLFLFLLLLLLLNILIVFSILSTTTASQTVNTTATYCQAVTADSFYLISVVVLVLVLFNEKQNLSYYYRQTLSHLFEKVYIQVELKFNSVAAAAAIIITTGNAKSYSECSNLMNDKHKINKKSDSLKTNRIYYRKYSIFFNKNYNIYIELEFIKFIFNFISIALVLNVLFLFSFSVIFSSAFFFSFSFHQKLQKAQLEILPEFSQNKS